MLPDDSMPDDPHDRGEADDAPEEVEAGLAFAYREDPESDSSASVIELVGERTGSVLRISLRDADPAGTTPMLRPLGLDEPRRAGKYVVQGELGRGGVGAVHRGHDQDLGRDVALKFLREKYRDDPDVLRRFVEEAQIGGQLQHPGIVPVYDLGMAKGRPYFAMRLVKGETLAKRLAERASVASERRAFLSIFEDVCQTMAYAHARGVVHRDLKPANVMIGSFGEVQVVDWGMGKVLRQGGVDDEELSSERQGGTVIETVRSKDRGSRSIVGSVMGTPAYMPPEQARGEVEAMDERSDVFTLGAILCEILTGKPPYVGAQSEQIVRAAAADLSDARERLATCGGDDDLVELANRCLAPAPAARPRNAEIVARAIHEHLAAAEARLHDARIEAAEARVRAASLKRTQKLGVALTAAIAAGLFASLWLWREADASALEARGNEARAERELARAVEIKSLLADMLRSVSPEEAMYADTTLMERILDDAAQRLEAGAIEDELVAAELHETIGETYLVLSLLDEAELHAVSAVAIRERVLGPSHLETQWSRKRLALLRSAQGRYDESEALYGEVLETHRCAHGRACALVRGVLRGLGGLYVKTSRWGEAEQAFREALAVHERKLGAGHRETLISKHGLANAYLMQGRLDEAERLFSECLETARGALGADHLTTIASMVGLARLLEARGRLAEAEPLLTEALELHARVLGEAHPITLADRQTLALLLRARGRYAQAERLLVETIEASERVLGEEHSDTLAARSNLASVLIDLGSYEEAARRLEELVAIHERHSGADSLAALPAKSNLANAYTLRGRDAEAEALYLEILAVERRELGEEHPGTLDTSSNLGSLYGARGRHDEAEELLRPALEVRRRVQGVDHPKTLMTALILADSLTNRGRADEAEPLLVDTLERMRRVLGDAHPTTLACASSLADALWALERADEAERLHRECIEQQERALGPEHPRTLSAAVDLGAAYASRGRFEDVVAVLAPRLDAIGRAFPRAHPRRIAASATLLNAYLALGSSAEAAPLQRALLDERIALVEAPGAGAGELNDAAWELLTHDALELRDPERALVLAERACELAERERSPSLWMVLDTLALAQHRTGDTAAAVRTQRRAVSLAPPNAPSEIANRLAEFEAAQD